MGKKTRENRIQSNSTQDNEAPHELQPNPSPASILQVPDTQSKMNIE